MKYSIIILLVILLSGCDILKSHSKYILEHADEIRLTLCDKAIDTTSHVSIIDTVYEIVQSEMQEVDSMTLMLFLYCDSNNQVMIKNSELLQSKNGKLLYELNKNKLLIRSLHDSIEVKDKIIYNTKTKTITNTIAVPIWTKGDTEYKIWWWEYIVWTLSGIIIIYLFIKKRFI